MPTFVRSITDERDGLLAFLAEQRAGLRRALHGLTDEQAAATPSASTLCLGGLIKHVTNAERVWVDRIAGEIPPSLAADWTAQFRMADGETVAGLLDAYAAVAQRTQSVVTELADLGEPIDISRGSQWIPPRTMRSPRWILFHLIQETARHAGHADIIRESLDGATAFDLVTAAGDSMFG